MSRRYDDPVDVRRRDEDPAEFLWRGRFYAVREVLARWVETGAWWQQPTGIAHGTGIADSTAAPRGLGSGGPGSAVSGESHQVPGEREVWRVEASAGRAQGSGIYDLCFDWSVGGWTLLSTQD